MCGITGFWHFSMLNHNPYKILQAMTHCLKHRGPDAQKTWVHENALVGLGHTRLAIQDLSSLGAQPMRAQHHNNWIVFNGEVYNTKTLRQQLEEEHNLVLRGHSDTEVFLEACSAWGVDLACQRANGMFAFVFWHESSQTLSLGRDRLGKKPLFWGIKENTLVFASELKSIYQHPSWNPEMDRDAVKHYFQLGYIPAPLSIDKHLKKLSPATIVTINPQQTIHQRCYWDFDAVVLQDPTARSTQEQIAWLNQSLGTAVQQRMVADVPLGAFLSGGIDSSLIVSIMQQHSRQKVKTFSIGFEDAHYNESIQAKRIANALGTDHHEMIFSSDQATNIAHDCPYFYDEPFSDASMLPTMLVSAMAKKQVTVALTGDGGDELFAGYNRYHIAHQLWKKSQYAPVWSRKLSAQCLQSFSTQRWDQLAKIIPRSKRPKRFGQKIHKFASVLPCQGLMDYYQMLVQNEHADDVCSQGKTFEWPPTPNIDPIAQMQWIDTKTYLTDDILTKVDRASMAYGLEARSPLLDYKIVELAWQLPITSKIKGKQSKWILRQLLSQYIPPSLFDRPKMGFGIPLGDWLRSHLRPWATELIEPLRDDPFLDLNYVKALWQRHLHGENHEEMIWRILMYLTWQKKWYAHQHALDKKSRYVIV